VNVTCPECQSLFRVDPAKVPPTGVRARCSVCGGVIPVGVARATPIRATEAVAPPVAAELPEPAPVFAEAVAQQESARVTERLPTPAVAAESVPRATPREPLWGSPGAVPAARFDAPSATPTATERAPTQPASPAASATPAAPATPGPRRPVNPYLSADPGHKARRLARALVSDLVAYHPQRREEGLRTGALKQLFRDEIRKSYEEYVEQVGAELAESTPYFRDALNDVLAGGRKVF